MSAAGVAVLPVSVSAGSRGITSVPASRVSCIDINVGGIRDARGVDIVGRLSDGLDSVRAHFGQASIGDGRISPSGEAVLISGWWGRLRLGNILRPFFLGRKRSEVPSSSITDIFVYLIVSIAAVGGRA